MWWLPTILSLCRVHFIQIQIIWPPFMCISAILYPLAKHFRTSFATCWSRLICPTTCYTKIFFELNINLLQNKVFSLELVPVVKMATRMNFFFSRIQSCAYMYHVSVQLHTKFEQGKNFCHFPGYLIPIETTYLKYNVISQITLLTLVDWKYPSKAQVYLL